MSPSLLPNSPNLDTERPKGGTRKWLTPLVAGWAAAAIVASFGWLYLIGRAAWSLLGWLP
jgi:hypothetical protein